MWRAVVVSCLVAAGAGLVACGGFTFDPTGAAGDGGGSGGSGGGAVNNGGGSGDSGGGAASNAAWTADNGSGTTAAQTVSFAGLGWATALVTVTGARGMAVQVLANSEASLEDGTAASGALDLRFNDSYVSGVAGPLPGQPLAEFRVGLRSGGTDLAGVFNADPSGSYYLPEDIGHLDSGMQIVLLGNAVAADQPVALYRLGASIPDPAAVSARQSGSTWVREALGVSGGELALPVGGTGVYALFASNATANWPSSGYHLQQTGAAGKQISIVALIDPGSTEVLGSWVFDRLSQTSPPATCGPADEQFTARVVDDNGRQRVEIRSPFGNRPMIRIIYTDGSKAEYSNPTLYAVTGDGSTGSAVTGSDDCSRPLAGFIRLTIDRPRGSWSTLNSQIVNPLRASTAYAGNVIVRYYRRHSSGGYYAVIDILTRDCLDRALALLPTGGSVTRLGQRAAYIQYLD